ncbi:MAG: hypothetical protein QM737_19825 [Ferruginibacter sp.]
MYKHSTIYLAYALLLTICSCSDHTHNNNNNKAKKETAEYGLPVPAKWKTEKFKFPPEFASQLPYTGDEDIRFSPGWESVTNDEHWAYCFLWWLNGDVKMDTTILQDNLKIYYSGLIGANVKERNIPGDKNIPVITAIKKITTASGDIETYNGTVTMVDYLDVVFNPITLNLLIHKKSCAGHTAVLVEISPRAYEHKVWKEMDGIVGGFECK